MKENWSPQSWKFKKALHQPVYDNVPKLNKITKKMKISKILMKTSKF